MTKRIAVPVARQIRRSSPCKTSRVIASNAVVISELAPISSSLEEIYFELTGSEEGAGPT